MFGCIALPKRSAFACSVRIVSALLAITLLPIGGLQAEEPNHATPVDLAFPESTPATQIYRAIGSASGLTILFDPGLPDRMVTLELMDVGTDRALDLLARAAGHFVVELDKRTVMVANDTPSRRRAHERVALETFYIENGRLNDVASALRALADAEEVVLDPNLHSVTVRESPDRMALIRSVIEAHDQRPGQLELSVELLQFDSQRLAEGFAKLEQNGAQPGPGRITVAELEQLRTGAGARVVGHTTLTLKDGSNADFAMLDRMTIGDAARSAYPIGFELDLHGRIHDQGQAVTLQVEFVGHLVHSRQSGSGVGPVFGSRSLSSEARIEAGETLLLQGLFQVAAREPDESWPPLSPLGTVLTQGLDQPSEVILAITPRIVSVPQRPASWRSASVRPSAMSRQPSDEARHREAMERMRTRLDQLPRGLQRQSQDNGS